MAAAAAATEAAHDREAALLDDGKTSTNTRRQKCLTANALNNSDNLANLLPTGTVLAFQMLSPVLSDQGQCSTAVFQYLTATLIALCALSCMILSFTDSFVDDHGVVHYVFATFRGVLVIDGSPPPPPERAAKYRVTFVDFVHVFMSCAVFGAVAILDRNVVSCFWPAASTSQAVAGILTTLPIAVAAVVSTFFVYFPTARHGIGFPVAPH